MDCLKVATYELRKIQRLLKMEIESPDFYRGGKTISKIQRLLKMEIESLYFSTNSSPNAFVRFKGS